MSDLFEETSPEGPVCDRCGRSCEPLELDVCPICQKNFCVYCAYRAGSRNYCGRPCGDAFFFGGEADLEDLDENTPEED